jgi:hypothetical protein
MCAPLDLILPVPSRRPVYSLTKPQTFQRGSHDGFAERDADTLAATLPFVLRGEPVVGERQRVVIGPGPNVAVALGPCILVLDQLLGI